MADHAVSGPYTHKNLTIFLLHDAGQSQSRAPLTLQEAMKRKLVVVRETGDVNRLTIQNRSNQDVFVQAGDIVKGGQQDRVLALDLIVPPKSGRIPIDAFCVEQGRWSRRGDEAVTAFSASDNAAGVEGFEDRGQGQEVAGRRVGERQQDSGEAGDEYDRHSICAAGACKSQARRGIGKRWRPWHIRRASGAAIMPTSSANGRKTCDSDAPVAGLTLAEQSGPASRASPSSLQLTLENKLVKDTANDYVKNLSSIINGKRDVVGFVFAINGQINSADVYSSNALFAKLWPKMLEASAIEAIAELKAEEKSRPVDVSAIKAFLRESHTGKAETKKVTARTSVVKSETGKNLFFETRDSSRNGKWVHRNYITK